MTVCEKMYNKISECRDAAMVAKENGDTLKAMFFSNAMRGLERKMKRMTIQQLSEVV